MAGRHQPQYARYTAASTNQSYPSTGGSSNNLNVPYSSQSTSTPYSNQTSPYHNQPSAHSPFTNSTSPSYHQHNHPSNTPHSKLNNNAAAQLRKYTLQPPLKKLPLSKTMPVLGYPDMFPQRSGQPEDILTETNVRHGFIDKPVVSNEHTCAHDIVYGKLQDNHRLLDELGSFMVDVFQRQSKAGYITGPSSFRPPVRTTLLDSKREQWMQELADGVTPLKKLARNVPHGYKGEKLLETLAANQVPFLRATWYIKVVGLSEMSQRNASNAASSLGPQPIQWTLTVTNFLKKQLNDLVPPQAQPANATQSPHPSSANLGRAGTGVASHNRTHHEHDNRAKVWATPESRARFEQRWSYSVKLTRWQYFEGLLDQRTFLKWSLDSLAASSTLEAMWLILTGIIRDFVDEYKRNRTLTKMLIEALIKSYTTLLQTTNTNDSTADVANVKMNLQRDIEALLQSLFLSTPDMFVIPKLYQQHKNSFERLLGTEASTKLSATLPEVCRVMREYWNMIKARNEVFCANVVDDHSIHTTAEDKAQRSRADTFDKSALVVSDLQEMSLEDRVIHVLDTVGRDIDSLIGLKMDGASSWVVASGFSLESATEAIFNDKYTRLQTSVITKIVSVMCHWATKDSNYGDWKIYLVSSIMSRWVTSRKSVCCKHLLQAALIQFLDDGITTNIEANAENGFVAETENSSITLLYDVLIRLQLFSYQKYLLRLIARGDLEPKHRDAPRIKQCLKYLASLPVPNSAPLYLINQRRVALYGTKNTTQDAAESEALNELKRLAILAINGQEHDDIHCLFADDAKEMTQPTATDTARSYYLSFNDDLLQQIELALSCVSRYTILKFTNEWLFTEVKKFVVKNIQIGEDNWRVMTSPGSSLLNTRQFVTIIRILECAQDYLTIIDFASWALEKTNESILYPYVIDCFRKYSVYWKLTLQESKVVDIIWQKHASLAKRNVAERCIMMYIIQLIQEGYTLEESLAVQLKQDLQIKALKRGRYNSNISIREELMQLVKEPSSERIQLVSESLSIPSRNAAGWIGEILQEVGELIRTTAKESQVSECISNLYNANVTQEQQSQNQFSPDTLLGFHRLIRAFALLIRNVADKTTFTGQADESIISWLQTSEVSLENMNQPCSWIPLLIALLVSHNVVNLKIVLQQLVLPWFEKAAREIQQSYDSEQNRLIIFCQNLIDVIRLLVVQRKNDNQPQQQPQQQQQQQQDGAAMPILWQLRAEEFYRLQSCRQSQLACNLSSIEPMFGLLERLVMIATNLPLSSSLLQSLVILRADLLQISWFRQACLRDLNGVYQRFAAHEAEATTEKRMKKKMLTIVEELIGENHVANNNNCSNHQASLIASEGAPDFVEKLQRVFMNVGQWNEAQCRVQMNLLLDNISLSDGQNQNPNNPHILSDDTSLMDMSLDGTTSSTPIPAFNKDLQSFVCFFYDVILSDKNNENDVDTNASSPASANATESQRRFQFFNSLIHELREPVQIELLNYGCRLLEGDSSQSFPSNITLSMPGTIDFPISPRFDSIKFAYRCNAFQKMIRRMFAATHIWTRERKVEFVRSIFAQINRYKSALAVFIVMQKASVCYADAVSALTTAKNDVDVAITLLMTDGLPATSGDEVTPAYPKLSLDDIRTSLLMRLRLVVPFASIIWEHESEYNLLEWIRAVMSLLSNPVVHGNGSQEQFFEFTLDFASLLIDEVPRDSKKACLKLLNSMHSELTSIPVMFHSRVKRIMPFLYHNMYLASTKLSSSILGLAFTNNPQQQQQHLETCLEQSKPWEWLEDHVSDPPHDNDAPISLALFNAKKLKLSETSTYTRWFQYGFDNQQLPNTNERLGHVVNKETEQIEHQKQLLPASPLEDELNGYPFIKQEDDDMDTCNNSNNINNTTANNDNTYNATTTDATPEIPIKRKLEMEEGELP